MSSTRRRSARIKKSRRSSGQSPEPAIPDTVTVTDSASIATAGSASTGSSTRRGFDVPVAKQILQDIECPELGGLERLKQLGAGNQLYSRYLDKLVEDRKTAGLDVKLYEDKDLRRRVQKQVTRWKALPKESYLDQLNQCSVVAYKDKKSDEEVRFEANGIKSPSIRQKNRKAKKKQARSDDQDLSELSGEEEESFASLKSAETDFSGAAFKEYRSPTPHIEPDDEVVPTPRATSNHHVEPDDEEVPTPKATSRSNFNFNSGTTRNINMDQLPAGTKKIKVDATMPPEKNGPVLLYDLGQTLDGKGKDGGDAKLHGVYAANRWEPRWVKMNRAKNWYTSKVVDDRHWYFRFPACEFALLYGVTDKNNYKIKPVDAAMVGLRGAAGQFDGDPTKEDRQWKHIVLEFPEGTELSIKALNPTVENQEVGGKPFALTFQGVTDTYIGFAVANLAKEGLGMGGAAMPVAEEESEEAKALRLLDIESAAKNKIPGYQSIQWNASSSGGLKPDPVESASAFLPDLSLSAPAFASAPAPAALPQSSLGRAVHAHAGTENFINETIEDGINAKNELEDIHQSLGSSMGDTTMGEVGEHVKKRKPDRDDETGETGTNSYVVMSWRLEEALQQLGLIGVQIRTRYPADQQLDAVNQYLHNQLHQLSSEDRAAIQQLLPSQQIPALGQKLKEVQQQQQQPPPQKQLVLTDEEMDQAEEEMVAQMNQGREGHNVSDY